MGAECFLVFWHPPSARAHSREPECQRARVIPTLTRYFMCTNFVLDEGYYECRHTTNKLYDGSEPSLQIGKTVPPFFQTLPYSNSSPWFRHVICMGPCKMYVRRVEIVFRMYRPKRQFRDDFLGFFCVAIFILFYHIEHTKNSMLKYWKRGDSIKKKW